MRRELRAATAKACAGLSSKQVFVDLVSRAVHEADTFAGEFEMKVKRERAHEELGTLFRGDTRAFA